MRWLITGGRSPISLAIARRRLGLGDSVVLTSRTAAHAEQACAALAAPGGRVESLVFDLASPSQSRAGLDALLEGGLHGVILVAAGRMKRLRRFHELDDAAVDDAVAADIVGNAWLLRRVLPQLESQRFGRLVFISSVSAVTGTSRHGTYCLAKAAIEGLMLNLAVDYAGANVLSNVVRPGIIETDRIRRLSRRTHWIDRARSLVPQGALGTAEQVAEVLDPLLSVTSYVNGAVFTVSGGLPLMRSEGLLAR